MTNKRLRELLALRRESETLCLNAIVNWETHLQRDPDNELSTVWANHLANCRKKLRLLRWDIKNIEEKLCQKKS